MHIVARNSSPFGTWRVCIGALELAGAEAISVSLWVVLFRAFRRKGPAASFESKI